MEILPIVIALACLLQLNAGLLGQIVIILRRLAPLNNTELSVGKVLQNPFSPYSS